MNTSSSSASSIAIPPNPRKPLGRGQGLGLKLLLLMTASLFFLVTTCGAAQINRQSSTLNPAPVTRGLVLMGTAHRSPGITITNPPRPNLPDAVSGRAYGLTFAASGALGIVTWTNPGGQLGTGACAGLTLSTKGVLSGTPRSSSSTCSFSVVARDMKGNIRFGAFSLTIQPALRVGTLALGNGVQNRPFSQAIPVIGGIMPLTVCSTVTLPAGLFITSNGSSCLISGTPRSAYGPGNITISVIDSSNSSTAAGKASGNVWLEINLPLAVKSPLRVINGMVGFPYPGMSFTATGGTGNGGGVTWTQAGARSPSGLCGPAGIMPPGLALSGTSGLISGVPMNASATAKDFQFQVCVEDSPTASTHAGTALSSTVVLNILHRYAYVTSMSRSIDIIDTASNTFVKAITLSPSASQQAITVTPDGRFVLAVDAQTNQLIQVDTIANTQVPGSPFALPNSCLVPWDVVIPPDPTLPGANHVFVSCSGGDDVTSFEEVVVLDAANLGAAPIAVMRTGPGSTPCGMAVRSDNSRIYVALNGNNQLLVIDNTLSTPGLIEAATLNLDSTTRQPLSIALAEHGSREYAYLTKQYVSSQDQSNPASGGIEVVDVTSDVLSTQVTVLFAPDSNFAPWGVAVSPSGKTVFVTSAGSGQIALLNNSVPTPTLTPGSPFTLPNLSGSAKGVAYDVAFPPVPTGTPAAYIPLYSLFGVAMVSDTVSPAALPVSPIQLPNEFLYKIRAIPVPR